MKTIVLGMALFLLWACFPESPAPEIEQPVSQEKTEPPVVDTTPKDTTVWKHLQLEPGEGVFQVLGRLNVSHAKKMRLINTLRFEADLTSLRAGERFSAKYHRDYTTAMRAFVYRPNRVTEHRITIDPLSDSLHYSFSRKETDVQERMLMGTIGPGSSLNASLLKAGLSQNITSVVNGILLCKVAFRTDARVGDTFTVLLHEEFYRDSLIPEFTRVLYTDYRGSRSGTHRAYRYSEEDETSIYNGHYTREGTALIHSAVRYPLDRLHVSSPYGWRTHPITGRRSFHNGIDYAIEHGAPVYAVAPGRVVVSGYDRYSGNKIAIRHADGYTSYYLHLSQKNVRVGQSVHSRQVIGRVGSTGMSTGPHLHLGFRNPQGNWVNPNSKRMIATQRLSGERLEKLEKQAARIDTVKEQIQNNDAVVFFDHEKQIAQREKEEEEELSDEG
ncbi:M23 family metallopeptidase [Chitinivibrio alkaliphilus]|uniref:Peptidase M23 n=1 Tax=Chitinivibrio alkaliphilus ACht1 TaxID=1313304 RepID=U7D657_9BACT|nr:peptidoglycan DD-metalloendopeptidase family protein [Chitinivibrio alkaliphilus]ERP31418.1 Peptidase M23 [Chitinivibrio alkaliphilus ACht1]